MYLSISALILSVLPLFLTAQHKDIIQGSREIDPRRYVIVRYKKTPTIGNLDTLWNWEVRRGVPNQKITFIDVDGEITIDFAKQLLIDNVNFEGTVSLEAEISGTNGTRKIEVSPYSEIGVQRIPIGIKSDPPFEIAKRLLNMIRELSDQALQLDVNMYYAGFKKRDFERNKSIKLSKRTIDSLLQSADVTIDGIRPVVVEFARKCEDQLDKYYHDVVEEYKIKFGEDISNAKTKQQLKYIVDNIYNIYDTGYISDRDGFIGQFSRATEDARDKIDVVLSYLNSFETSGEDAMKALLSLINKDLINYASLKKNLIDSKEKILNINVDIASPDSLALYLLQKKPEIDEASRTLTEYSRFSGSVLEEIIQGIMTQQDKSRYSALASDDRNNFNIKFIEENITEISRQLSVKAGEMIYRKLVYATIDLSKSGAKVGEVLNIYVTWIMDAKRDSLANSPRLPIGKYYLKETGWRIEIADMFSLIKRINEPLTSESTVSPSNFKGSGGAVLMWTYNKLDKGLEITSTGQSNYEVTTNNKLANFFEPSIGLNVSYLDFSTDKDVEIGTGLQFGLFRNRIFFGYGANLHMLSPGGQSPFYYYVGFSFAKLSDLFKSSNSVTSFR